MTVAVFEEADQYHVGRQKKYVRKNRAGGYIVYLRNMPRVARPNRLAAGMSIMSSK
ncbi:MAG: hypothetical protein KDK08_05465 [Rhizobiaceae bacterium]|nr:hypothetical protein [Rhizobiaceae bacterium]MCC0000917.1 hypothetical protein [Methylobacteriaceae bacterium]